MIGSDDRLQAALPADSPADCSIRTGMINVNTSPDRSIMFDVLDVDGWAKGFIEMTKTALVAGTDAVRIPIMCPDLRLEGLMNPRIHM